MNKYLRIIAVVIILIIILIIISIINNKFNKESIVQSYIFKSDLDKNKIELNSENIMIDYPFDYNDKEELAKNTDYIIVGEIKEIEKQYWEPEQNNTITLGTIKIKKVFKGNLKKGEKISFIRDGGIISLKEFEDSLEYRTNLTVSNLSKEDRIKKYGLDELTENEKKNKFVFDGAKNDIPVENNKTYLIYLNYNEDLERYEIKYNLYGLREVDMNKIILNYNNIKVKNNKTGKYEPLDAVLSTELVSTSLFDFLNPLLTFFDVIGTVLL